MIVEITSAQLTSGVVRIDAIDVSEENLQWIERSDDGSERELTFLFDTKDPRVLRYIRKWLKNQQVTQGCCTYKEALNSVIGTVTDISGKYLSW